MTLKYSGKKWQWRHGLGISPNSPDEQQAKAQKPWAVSTTKWSETASLKKKTKIAEHQQQFRRKQSKDRGCRGPWELEKPSTAHRLPGRSSAGPAVGSHQTCNWALQPPIRVQNEGPQEAVTVPERWALQIPETNQMKLPSKAKPCPKERLKGRTSPKEERPTEVAGWPGSMAGCSTGSTQKAPPVSPHREMRECVKVPSRGLK